MYIKVTDYYTQRPIYVNSDKIIYMDSIKDATTLYFQIETLCITVKESMEEIIKQINNI